jgi:Ca2+-binding EF-hand superfamily protein
MSRTVLSLTMAVSLVVGGACGKSASQRGNSRHRQTIEERFAQLDTNKDGKLSFQEFKATETQPAEIARLQKQFQDVDTNHDGSLSLDESKAYFEKMRSQRRGGLGRYGATGRNQ